MSEQTSVIPAGTCCASSAAHPQISFPSASRGVSAATGLVWASPAGPNPNHQNPPSMSTKHPHKMFNCIK